MKDTMAAATSLSHPAAFTFNLDATVYIRDMSHFYVPATQQATHQHLLVPVRLAIKL